MKVLIIDNNKISRLYISSLLEEHFPVIKKIDEAGTVSAAKGFLENSNYDLIFLDMELKDGMGFDVLKEIKEFVFVIVVTDYKEYAIQAFKHNVVDYILKPIDLNEFKNAVKKVVRLHQKEEIARHLNLAGDTLKNQGASEDALMINYKNKYIALAKKDIVFIKALGKYSEIHVASKSHYTSYKNLKEFERVMTDTFVRVHHSYLVNFKCIVSYSRETSHVMLSNGDEVPVSVRKREELFKRFKVF